MSTGRSATTHTEIVQGIEHAEDIKPILDRFLRKVIDSVIPKCVLIKYCTRETREAHLRVAGVSYTISTTDESLERDVWNEFAEGSLREPS